MPSTVVAFTNYDSNRHVLEVGYRSGARYRYFDVPEIVYAEFQRSGSKGRFLNTRIKPHYAFTQVMDVA